MELKKRSSDLIIEYKKITNPSGLKSVLVDREDMIKERARVLLFKVCISLIAIDAYDDVRETLALLSYDTKSMSDEQVKSKVEELLRSALFEQKRSDDMRSDEKKEKATPEQIRSSFDAEIAFLMTFFKMNIDVRNISAAVYANIVHRRCRDKHEEKKSLVCIFYGDVYLIKFQMQSIFLKVVSNSFLGITNDLFYEQKKQHKLH